MIKAAILLALLVPAPPLSAQSPDDAVRARSRKEHRDLDRMSRGEAAEEEEAPAPAPRPRARAVPRPEPAPAPEPEPAPEPKKEPEFPVTVFWHMADDADVYLNGRPLREYKPSFKTRGDEAPQPPFSAKAVLRDGDVFTVGGRRGGSYGLMLLAVDDSGKVLFKTDAEGWKVYEPGERADWFEPAAARQSKTRPVVVQPNPWHPQVVLNEKHGKAAQSIWGNPSEGTAYLYGVFRPGAAPQP